MRLALWVLVVVLGTTAAGCSSSNYGEVRYGDVRHGGYNPNYAYAPQYSNETPASR